MAGAHGARHLTATSRVAAGYGEVPRAGIQGAGPPATRERLQEGQSRVLALHVARACRTVYKEAGFVRKMKCLQRPIPTKKRYPIPLPVSHWPWKSLTLTEPSPPGGRWGALQQPRHPSPTLPTRPPQAATGALHRDGPQEGRQSLPHEIEACILPPGGPPAHHPSAGVATSVWPLLTPAGLGYIGTPSVLGSAAQTGGPALPHATDKLRWQDTLCLQGPKSTERLCGVSLLGRRQSQKEASPALRKLRSDHRLGDRGVTCTPRGAGPRPGA